MRMNSLTFGSSYFAPGKLTELGEKILSGADRKSYRGMKPDDLIKLANFYSLPKTLDLREIPDEEELQIDNQAITGLDLKTITLVMWQKPRTAYVDFGKIKQVHSSLYSGAVPIPLLGLKRKKNRPYSFLNDRMVGWVELDDDNIIVEKKPGALERCWITDMWLGQTFTSTKWQNDQIVWAQPGLLLLNTLAESMRPTAAEVRYLREKGMGGHKGHWATAYGTASADIPDDKKLRPAVLQLYNKCDSPMRLMLAQRWCWFPKQRNKDMISDAWDFDNQPPAADKDMFAGLEPQPDTKASSPLDLMRSK